MTYDPQTLSKALSKARVHFMAHSQVTFWIHVMLAVEHRFSTEVPTAGTDGLRILYNPDYFMQQTEPARVGLVYHETAHIVLEHCNVHGRIGDRNFNRWNVAADHVINLLGNSMGFKFPAGALMDSRYTGMFTEQVYDLNPDVPTDFKPDLTMKPATEADEIELDSILVQASIAAQKAGESIGNLPSSIQRKLKKLLQPQIPWHRVLNHVLQQTKKTELSFRRVNKRFLQEQLMPSRFSEGMGDIAVAIDASASVTEAGFSDSIDKTETILKTLQPSSIEVLQFTTHIECQETVKSLHELQNITLSTTGGTSVRPVLEWAKKNKPEALIIFTDGYFHLDAAWKPKCPVIWVIHSNPEWKASFGKTVHYTLNE